MTLQSKIKSNIKEAMMAKDSVRLETMRAISSAITNFLLQNGRTPQDEATDEEVMSVIVKLSKQRKDSISQFESGGRSDLAELEKAQLRVLEEFLPAQMSQDEIMKVITIVKDRLGITDPSKKGMLMGAVIKELKGAADGAVVKELVDKIFA